MSRRLQFRWLLAGEAASRVGSEMTLVALPLTAVLVLHSSTLAVAILVGAGSAANLLFGLPLGVIADRVERRRLMRASAAASLLVVLVVPLLAVLGSLSIGVLWVAALLLGGFTLLFDSAMAGYLPQAFGRDNLVTINARLQGTWALGQVGGPSLAGVLMSIVSAPFVLLVDAASFLFSFFALGRLPRVPAVRTREQRSGLLVEIREGASVIWRNPVQRSMVMAATHANLFTTLLFAVLTVYLVRVLGFSATLVGLTSAALGVGAVLGVCLGPACVRRFRVSTALIAAYAVPGLGALMIALAAQTSGPGAFALVGAGEAIWACAVVINIVVGQTVGQQLVADEVFGRASATARFVTWGIEPFGALAGGLLAGGVIGVTGTLYVAAAGLVTTPIWLLNSHTRSLPTVANMQARAPSPTAAPIDRPAVAPAA